MIPRSILLPSTLLALAVSVTAEIIPQSIANFNDVNQLSGEGVLIEAGNAGSPNSLTIPGVFTFEGYTDANRGTGPHLNLFPTTTSANNESHTSHYQPATHIPDHEEIAGITEAQARILFETRRVGTGAASHRTRVFFQGLDTNTTYLIQFLVVDDSVTTSIMNITDRDDGNAMTADYSKNAVQLVTFRGKPVSASGDYVYFYRDANAAILNAYQIRQVDGLEVLDPELELQPEGTQVRLNASMLPTSKTSTLQESSTLAAGDWSNLFTSSGSATASWTRPIVAGENRFYRIIVDD
jgi:hypothetical protein